MMQAIATILAFSCLAHFASASVQPLDCPDGPSSRCTAVAGLQIVTTSGSCSGRVGADCTVWTKSEDVYVGEFVTFYSNPDRICDRGFVMARATAIATAIAEVHASTFVSLTCTGTGFACGWSFAGGEGFALSVAEAVAFAAATASVQTGTDIANSFCFADIRAISGAIAAATTSAFSDTCTSGGTAEDWQRSYARAIQQVVVNALATAFSRACIEPSDTSSATECTGGTSNASSGGAGGTGEFCAGTDIVTDLCTGSAGNRCCASTQDFCPPIGPCPGCQLPWVRAGPSVWQKNDGKFCLCA
ncbi:hypothetical protein BSKO_09760 [Bryopsis sp. KO-2023]|nr:hypothetical protein BSKO_09760 [Bryopsis sp. KO-2023]